MKRALSLLALSLPMVAHAWTVEGVDMDAVPWAELCPSVEAVELKTGAGTCASPIRRRSGMPDGTASAWASKEPKPNCDQLEKEYRKVDRAEARRRQAVAESGGHLGLLQGGLRHGAEACAPWSRSATPSPSISGAQRFFARLHRQRGLIGDGCLHQLFDALDDVLDRCTSTRRSRRRTGYVAGPIAVLGTISFVAMGAVLLRGMSEIPLAKFVQTAALLALVFAVAGTAGHYNTYLADHLRAFPDELLGDLRRDQRHWRTTPPSARVLDDVGDQAMTGISAIWSAGGFTDPGPSLFAAVLFVIFLIFGVAAVIALATAKIGLSLVVAVGPLMILGLLFQSTREYFTKWLSYGIQFAFLAMFVGGIAGMADAIVDTYIDALDDSAENVDLVALMAPALMLLLLAKIFAELPHMASSLSGGIGLVRRQHRLARHPGGHAPGRRQAHRRLARCRPLAPRAPGRGPARPDGGDPQGRRRPPGERGAEGVPRQRQPHRFPFRRRRRQPGPRPRGPQSRGGTSSPACRRMTCSTRSFS